MTVLGVDYAWNGPSAQSITGAGYKFAFRYYGGSTGKRLHRAEVDLLQANGVVIGTVFEGTADRARHGAAAGAADGVEAAQEANACGQPVGTCIYFAVDYDAPASDIPAILAYGDAFARASGHPTGPYGGFRVCDAWLKSGRSPYAWQTAAWSGGRRAAGIKLFQRIGTVLGDCDVDEGLDDDIGAWSTLSGFTPPHVVNLPVIITITDPSGDDEMMRADDPVSGGFWLSNAAGEVWSFNADGVPNGDGGAPSVKNGNLTGHPEWQAGTCVGFAAWKGNGTNAGGNGYVFVTVRPNGEGIGHYNIPRQGF